MPSVDADCCDDCIYKFQVNTKFVQISKKQSLQAAVAADNKVMKMKTQSEHGPSSTADHPFEGKAYVQVIIHSFTVQFM